MEKKLEIVVTGEYEAKPDELFDLISKGNLFRLTGADQINFDFQKNGLFKFEFTNRGIISGSFTEIIPGKKISMLWNVSGFGRENENGTEVVISISEKNNHTSVEVRHSDILNAPSAEAKQRAWTEILNNLKK